MPKKKECFNCKYREFDYSTTCGRDGELICSETYWTNKKACKYYKRDYTVITAKGFWKYFELNNKQYVWKRGKFREITNTLEKEIIRRV